MDGVRVDGGSQDGTIEQYAKHSVRVVPQTTRGRGAAMRLAAESTNADYLIFFSPDGNEDWRDISKFRSYFEQGYDLVIASRTTKGAHNEEDDQVLRAATTKSAAAGSSPAPKTNPRTRPTSSSASRRSS